MRCSQKAMDEVSEQSTYSIHGMGQAPWRRVIDFVAPPKCLVCREAVLEPASLCLSCWTNLRFIDAPYCNVLGRPFAYDQGEEAISPAALTEPPTWDRARAAVAYDEASRGDGARAEIPRHHGSGFADGETDGARRTAHLRRRTW